MGVSNFFWQPPLPAPPPPNIRSCMHAATLTKMELFYTDTLAEKKSEILMIFWGGGSKTATFGRERESSKQTSCFFSGKIPEATFRAGFALRGSPLQPPVQVRGVGVPAHLAAEPDPGPDPGGSKQEQGGTGGRSKQSHPTNNGVGRGGGGYARAAGKLSWVLFACGFGTRFVGSVGAC